MLSTPSSSLRIRVVADVAHVWPDDPFDESEDLTPAIREALDSPDPAGALNARWPWVSDDARRRFLVRVGTREEDLTTLILRYDHTVKVEWADRYMAGDPTASPSWWTRLLKREGK